MADAAPMTSPSPPSTPKPDAAALCSNVSPSAFERLPDEIISQILLVADPDCFASLIVLNQQTRRVSQQADLYASQLQRCASYATAHAGFAKVQDDDLPRFRRLFAREVKRNLFNAYNRPSETLVKLVSNSNSSSSCPGGEGMQFSASSKGHYLLAYNSSRIYVLAVSGPDLQVKRELKIQRRPVSATITDDAATLVVLSTEMQVNLYDLQVSPPKRKHAIILDNNPRTIAISSCGSVMAAAYDTGIEVSSLHPNAMSTERRQVKCDPVDNLAFSFDGTQILGTTIHSNPPNTVVLTAPYYDPATVADQDNLSAMWTTSILFPNTSHDCSHAVLLQNGTQEEACWAFAYDRSFEAFRAIRIDDLRNGTTYFTGPVSQPSSQSKLLPSTLPAAAYHGHLVAAGFHGSQVWVYGVPEDLDAVPEQQLSISEGSSGPGRNSSQQSNLSRHNSSRGQDENTSLPQWQLLCDKTRNHFMAGTKVADLTAISTVKWVEGFADSSAKDRLLVTSRGISPSLLVTDEEDIDFVDGGRVCILDFEYGPRSGSKREVTIDVGTDDAEVLQEEQRDIETEVAIVRRRTVVQNRSSRNQLLRAATTASQHLMPPMPPKQSTEDDDPLVPRKVGVNPVNRTEGDEEESFVPTDEMEALDAPYSHASPRSTTTLRRAATAAAVNRRLNPRTADGQRVVYRRADGRGELPHESDADNWVPPPPPYQPDDPGTMPAFLRRPAVAPLPSPVRPFTALVSTQTPAWPGQFSPRAQQAQMHGVSIPLRQRTASDETTYSSMQRFEEIPRPLSTPLAMPVDAESVPDDLYGVSPSASPAPEGQSARGVSEEPQMESVSPDLRQSETATVATTPATLEYSDAVEQIQPNHGQIDNLGLSVAIPPAQLSSVGEEQVHNRRLSNAQTWPLVGPMQLQQVPPPVHHDIAAYSAPASDATMAELASSSFPPAPSSDQMNRLNKRISMGAPRRLSGGILNQWSVPGSRASLMEPPTKHHTVEYESAPDVPLVNPDEDQPLIISTPKGVSGAFDSPGETQILAPVPRRPRQSIPFNPGQPSQPVQSLFPSLPNEGGNGPSQKARHLPSWLSSPPAGSTRSPMRVSRRPSRAERGAAKNIVDAKKRGWRPKSKKSKEPQPTGSSLEDSGWTDVPTQLPQKDHRKCVVM
ncbi:F-box domain-containing protein [Beauveria bassiana ARSEF 2860]|uniref:F-box domain-containing protein n=1 Tax=Beauveria bassiana (strain ARSEF 2860) TaxID=655819 RepID=J5JPG8_BEAB2|nr:F-box domain-containing protein [Beauveria bassiana ARSEF 2860]EJP67028.1 F-box domain-containing protein [Beauveria bassiana ARSEF 2860]